MTQFYALAAILVAIGGFWWWAWSQGKKSARADITELNGKIKDAQLKAANQPRDRLSTIDKLRSGKF